MTIYYPQRWLSINKRMERALAILIPTIHLDFGISYCANKKGTRNKSQERLKSDLGFRFFGISVRKINKCPE